MPLATSYTEATLADFMVRELSSTGVLLGLTDSSDGIAAAVQATARLLGDDIADLTDMAVLEAAATWKAWQAAEAAAISLPVKLKSDGDEIDRSALLANIRARLVTVEGAYYTAAAVSGGASMFAFATVPGCRGR